MQPIVRRSAVPHLIQNRIVGTKPQGRQRRLPVTPELLEGQLEERASWRAREKLGQHAAKARHSGGIEKNSLVAHADFGGLLPVERMEVEGIMA